MQQMTTKQMIKTAVAAVVHQLQLHQKQVSPLPLPKV